MKAVLSVLAALLAFAAVLGLITSRRESARAQALAAELAQARATYDSASALWLIERAKLEASRLELVRDSSVLAQRLSTARTSARVATERVAALLATQGHDTSGVVATIRQRLPSLRGRYRKRRSTSLEL